jgi:hypothetical protein
VEEATVQSGGEPLSELIWSGARGSSCSPGRVGWGRKGEERGGGRRPCPLFLLLLLSFSMLPLVFRCRSCLRSSCWGLLLLSLLFSAAVFCYSARSLVGSLSGGQGFEGARRATGKPDRSRLPLAAATATVNVFFSFSFSFLERAHPTPKKERRLHYTRSRTHARTYTVPIYYRLLS